MPAEDVEYNVSDSKKRQKVKGKKSTTDKKKPAKRRDEESEAWAEYRKQQASKTQKERRAAEFDWNLFAGILGIPRWAGIPYWYFKSR